MVNLTAEQKQCLLTYLRYDTGGVDNIWGSKSIQATKDFQASFGGLAITGEVDEATHDALLYAAAHDMFKSVDAPALEPEITGTFWDEIEFFDREEFRCQCGGRYCNGFHVEPQEKMVRTVDEIRRRLGVPVSIVDAGGSGVRCPQHNINVGGVANSLHVTGNAADLHSSKSPQEMYRVAEEVLGNTGELGLYDWGIHVGIGKYSRFNG